MTAKINKQFIDLLKELNSKSRLDQEIANKEVKRIFPSHGEGTRTKNFFRSIVREKIDGVAKKDLEQVLKLLNTIYPRLNPNTRTLDAIYTIDVRNPLSSKYGKNSEIHELSKKLLKISYSEKSEILNEDKKRVQEKEENRLEYHDRDVIDIVSQNIGSSDAMRLAMALLMASGSRPIELFERSSYQVEEGNDHWILQYDLAKKRGAIHEGVAKPVIFITNKQFVNLVSKLRNQLTEKYGTVLNEQNLIKSAITTALNKTSKELFEHRENFTPYSARKLYGALSYQLYGKSGRYGDNPTLNRWLTAVLGHSKGSIATSHHYSNFELKNDNLTDSEIHAKLAEVQVGIESLEERFEEAKVPELDLIQKPKVKNSELKNVQFKKLDKLFDQFFKNSKKIPTQTYLENEMKGIVPRSIVRVYYKQKLLTSLDS